MAVRQFIRSSSAYVFALSVLLCSRLLRCTCCGSRTVTMATWWLIQRWYVLSLWADFVGKFNSYRFWLLAGHFSRQQHGFWTSCFQVHQWYVLLDGRSSQQGWLQRVYWNHYSRLFDCSQLHGWNCPLGISCPLLFEEIRLSAWLIAASLVSSPERWLVSLIVSSLRLHSRRPRSTWRISYATCPFDQLLDQWCLQGRHYCCLWYHPELSEWHPIGCDLSLKHFNKLFRSTKHKRSYRKL